MNKDLCKPLSCSSAPNALTERVKELNCLYGISNLLENQDVSLSWIMQRAVELIPAAWQYPENACARIRIDGREYTSSNFRTTRWRQNTRIILNGKHIGDVDVYYLQVPPSGEKGLFLEEEKRLLLAIGERLSKVLWLKRSEEALKESEERYRVLAEHIAEGVALVQDDSFCYINPEFCRMFDIPAAEDVCDAPVNHPPVGDANRIAQIYMTAVNDNIQNEVEELHHITRTGKAFWIQVYHNSITFRGRPALLSTFKDITEIKEQQMDAQREADLLNKENRALRSSCGNQDVDRRVVKCIEKGKRKRGLGSAEGDTTQPVVQKKTDGLGALQGESNG
jgi:two-component system, NtrC family, response regulator HydG